MTDVIMHKASLAVFRTFASELRIEKESASPLERSVDAHGSDKDLVGIDTEPGLLLNASVHDVFGINPKNDLGAHIIGIRQPDNIISCCGPGRYFSTENGFVEYQFLLNTGEAAIKWFDLPVTDESPELPLRHKLLAVATYSALRNHHIPGWMNDARELYFSCKKEDFELFAAMNVVEGAFRTYYSVRFAPGYDPVTKVYRYDTDCNQARWDEIHERFNKLAGDEK